MKTITFTDLTNKQKEFIYDKCMTGDFNQILSFAIVDDKQEVIGYALLQENSIDGSISPNPVITFDIKQYACEIIRIGVADTFQSKDATVIDRVLKEILNKVESWVDPENGCFRYYWGSFGINDPACAYADALDCSVSKYLVGSNTVRYIIYKQLVSAYC